MFPNTFYLLNHDPSNTQSEPSMSHSVYSFYFGNRAAGWSKNLISHSRAGVKIQVKCQPRASCCFNPASSHLSASLCSVLSEPFPLLPRGHSWGQTCIVRCFLTVRRVYATRFFVSSQQKFGVTDIKALSVRHSSRVLDRPCYSS